MLAKLKNKLITDLSINIYQCSDLFSFGTSGLKKFTVAEVTRNFLTPLVMVELLRDCSVQLPGSGAPDLTLSLPNRH